MRGLVGLQRLAPAAPPLLTVEELRTWLRVDHDDEDALIASLEVAARQRVEDLAQRTTTTTIWQATFDGTAALGCGRIYLPRPPLVSVDVVTSYPGDSATGEVLDPADYFVETGEEPGFIAPIEGAGAYSGVDRLRVEFTAGYATVADVPPPLVQAVRMLVAHWFENRETTIVGTNVAPMPEGVDALCSLARVSYSF